MTRTLPLTFFIGTLIILSTLFLFGCTGFSRCGNAHCEKGEATTCPSDCQGGVNEKPPLFTNTIDINAITQITPEHSVLHPAQTYYLIDGTLDGNAFSQQVLPNTPLTLSQATLGTLVFEHAFTSLYTDCNKTYRAQLMILTSTIASDNNRIDKNESISATPPFKVNELIHTHLDHNVEVRSIDQNLISGEYELTLLFDEKPYTIITGNGLTLGKTKGSVGSGIKSIDTNLMFIDVNESLCRKEMNAQITYRQTTPLPYLQQWTAYVHDTNNLRNTFEEQQTYRTISVGDDVTVKGRGAYEGKILIIRLINIIVLGAGYPEYQAKLGLFDANTLISTIQVVPPTNLATQFGKDYFFSEPELLELGINEKENGFMIIKP